MKNNISLILINQERLTFSAVTNNLKSQKIKIYFSLRLRINYQSKETLLCINLISVPMLRKLTPSGTLPVLSEKKQNLMKHTLVLKVSTREVTLSHISLAKASRIATSKILKEENGNATIKFQRKKRKHCQHKSIS